MEDNLVTEASANTDRFYTVIKSMHEFDKTEVHGIVMTQLSLTPRETCFVGTYYRVLGNVETLLRMDKAKDFQAIAMLARALFELSVDLKLLQAIPDGWAKLITYSDVEKLHAAKRICAFKFKNPGADIDTTVYDTFIAKKSAATVNRQATMWPGNPNPKHWSGLNLEGRATLLKAPFDEIYAVDYSRISWYAHLGLTGVLDMQAVTFIHLCAYAFHLAAKAYQESLLTIIQEFKITKANDKIEQLLKLAKQLPFTDTPDQVEALTRIALA
jgi:hypothetical protein